MGIQNTGPGYWRAAQDKVELFQRNPSEPAPPFRLSGVWVALWIFLLLLGGVVAYMAFDSLQTGRPWRRGESVSSSWIPLILGLGLMSAPIWHYPQIRKDWGRLSPRMTVTAAGVDIYVMAAPRSLGWEAVRGFRVDTTGSWDQLVADLTKPHPNPVKKGPAQVTSYPGVSCLEPHSTAYVLNSLLARPDLRADLGSPRSEAEINALMVSAVPAKPTA
ncbi:PH domain-containing protein [Arthrobacter zhaoxinii]|uniref:PH domain-containing protein n=1 Tax=Arthrobacter zhaoxinii TaxID=2964616 RepID=UPI002102F054|nr:PH domain-containing protein [Arthrobacter zhaoxinii]MCQ2000008.1 PH domain-containing protein [Arthrobacter zhaoxinii]